MQWEKAPGRNFIAVAFLSILFFLGCAGTRQSVSEPFPPKPETSELVSEVQKTDRAMVPPAPAVPSPPSPQPEPPTPEPQAAPKPHPGDEEAAQDPIASGAVLLNPSVFEDAKAIQSRLAELGVYKMAIDGMWGRDSRAALRFFKEKNSLKSPEQWDKETQLALFGKGGAPGPPVDTSDPLVSGTVILTPSNPQDAQTIQGRLAEVGLYGGPVDGIWGKDSRAALRDFKEKNSLPNPEKWDKETQIHLFKGTSK
jgi:peptidoglycan hydrolase-like protein with peptidoglycan-binding domain